MMLSLSWTSFDAFIANSETVFSVQTSSILHEIGDYIWTLLSGFVQKIAELRSYLASIGKFGSSNYCRILSKATVFQQVTDAHQLPADEV